MAWLMDTMACTRACCTVAGVLATCVCVSGLSHGEHHVSSAMPHHALVVCVSGMSLAKHQHQVPFGLAGLMVALAV